MAGEGTHGRIVAAALAYAAPAPDGQGWPVFPCDPRQDAPGAKRRRSKAPLVAGQDKDAQGKRIPRTGGLWRASDDPQQIEEWWRRYPAALIGIPMGARSGVFVLDLDPRGEPVAAVEKRLIDAVGELPFGPRSVTQSGGLHLWYKLPEREAALPRNSAKRLANVDWRGDGGYVIVPPSVMRDGAAYNWEVAPEDAPFPEAPPALLDLVYQRGVFARDARGGSPGGDHEPPSQPRMAGTDDPAERAVRRYALGALERARADVASAAQGTRGHTLNAAAYGMAGLVALGVLSEREVHAALADGADACGLTGTDGERERNAKIERGLAAGAGNTAALARRLDTIRAEARARAERPAEQPWLAAPPGGDEGPPPEAPIDGLEPPASGGGDAGNGGAGDGAGDEEEPDPEILRECSFLEQNDTANGRRLLLHFGAEVVAVRDIGPHVWAGTHWEYEGGAEALQRYAQRTAKRIALEAPLLGYSKEEAAAIEAAEGVDHALLGQDGRQLKDPAQKAALRAARGAMAAAEAAAGALADRRAARRRFSVSCGNSNRINGMCDQAGPHMTVPPAALDAEPLAINVRNGTLRLYKEQVRELDPDCPDPAVERWLDITRWRVRLDAHNRGDLIAKCMPADYVPGAQCPKWEAFMRRFQPAEHVRRFLQSFHGYALTGHTGEQVFVFNYGLGANGKSTFMEAIARLMGNYAKLLPAEALTGDLQRRGDNATPEFARLPGARLVRCAELPRGQGFRENTIKLLTGGEPILVRHLHKEFFELRPSFKAVGSGNDKPSIGGVDEGIWRRMRLVPWGVTIPVAERRPMERVLREFEAEASGILNWLLEGLVDYLENGLTVPEEITAATESYRADMDPVGEFAGACLVAAPGDAVAARAMYEAYVAWCHANSVKPYSERNFAAIMVQKGYRKSHGRIRLYHDLRLEGVPDDPAQQQAAPGWGA